MTAWTGGTVGASRAEIAGRWLVLLVLAGLMISPPVAVAGQVGLVALFLVSPQARALLARTWREPAVKAAALFLALVAIGVTYSAAGYQEGLSTLWGWRKLLMLPIALAFFGPSASRQWLATMYLGASTLVAATSFVFFFLQRPLLSSSEPGVFGIVARNHSTQGAMLSVAVFAAAWLFAFGTWRDRRQRNAWLAAGVLVAANIFFVTPGRAGYVVLLVCAAAFVLGWAVATGHGLRRGLVAAAVLVPVLLAGLAAVPASRARITQAIGELVTYKEQKQITSMGIRVVFWRNTLPLIAQRPLLGWGTGGFERAYAAQVAGQDGVLGTGTRDPHNQYLSVAAQHGMLGLALFLAFLAALARQRAPLPYRVFGLGVLAAWCVTGLANSHFATFAEGTFLYIWLGAMLGSRPQAG